MVMVLRFKAVLLPTNAHSLTQAPFIGIRWDRGHLGGVIWYTRLEQAL
jgi:hypothetical protein